MADQEIAFGVKIDGVERSINSIKDLKSALKDAKDEQLRMANQFGEGSKQYQDATKNISKLKDKVDDLADSTKSLKGSGIERANEGFSQLGEGLKNLDFDKVKVGFSAMKTAMAAVGIGLIVQLVSYLIENFDELSKGSGGLAKALRFVGDIIGKIISMGTDLLNFVTDFIGLTSESERAMEAQGEAIVDASKKTKDALADQVKGFDNQIAAAKAAGKSTVALEIEKQEAIIATNKKIAEQIIAFVRSGGQLTDEQKKLFNESVANIKAAKAAENIITITANKVANDKIAEQNKEAAAKRKAEKEKQDADDKKAKEDLIAYNRAADIENQKIDNQEALAKANLKIAKNQEDVNAKIALLKVQRDIELQNNILTDSEKLLIEQKFLNDKAALIKAAADKAAADKKALDAKALAATNAENTAAAELAVLKEGNDLADLTNQLTVKRDIELQNANLTASQKLLIEEKYNQDVDKLETDAAAKKLAKEVELMNAIFAATKQGLDSLQAISDIGFQKKLSNVKKGSKEEDEILRKQFERNKAFQMATAIMAGVQSILAITMVPDFSLGVVNGLRIASQVALTATSIAKIASTKYSSNASGGGGAESAGGGVPSIPPPPTIATPENNTNKTTSFDETGKNLNFEATTTPTINVKASVGVDEITSKSNRVEVLENQSTF